MNILIPDTWLRQHLNTSATSKQIQTNLSLSGPSVERIETIEGEPVYDIEVTTNRVDSMSVRGIAREAAAILPQFNLKATLKPLDDKLPSLKSLPHLDLTIKNDPSLCKRLMGIVLDVTVSDSPAWLQKRLRQVGQRPLNNLIDATNYIMWELGHPTHVFDYDKFTQKKLIVREATKGEKVTTLDNKSFTTVGGEVVFDDGSGSIIDMPGLMGTQNTLVDQGTTKVLYFIDSVVAEKIRFASMTHNIRSQAAILNEKNVDPSLADQAMALGIKLLIDIAQAKPLTQIYDDFPGKPKVISTRLTQSKIDNYLGLSLPKSKVESLLNSLKCTVKTTTSKKVTTYQITPPTFRHLDLQEPHDYIEEIARLYGYHNLPSLLMSTTIPQVDTNLNHHFEHQLKSSLALLGAQEVYTYSLVSSQLAQHSKLPLDNHLKLKNPLTDDLVYLRRSLLPSLHQVLEDNSAHQPLTVFELAHIYEPQPKDLPQETLTLALASNAPFPEFKGLLDALAQILRLPDFHIIPKSDHPYFLSDSSGTIFSADQLLGYLGLTHQGSLAATLDFNSLLASSKSHPSYFPVATTSPIIEDITFTFPPKTPLGVVIRYLLQQDLQLASVTLKGVYQDNATFTLTFHDPTKQLSKESVTPLRQKLVKLIESKFAAKLVGQV